MAKQIEKLRDELHRTKTMLDKVNADNTRLQYEIDTVYLKNGTYRIICHLRNEIQRLTISKLVLIQSTALEIDRLRQIIRSLSLGEDIADIPIHEEYSKLNILNDLLPPPTPTSPPSDFSWKETYNIELNEQDTDSKNEHKLDQEDDIKIPEMNLDLEDGAINPISLIQRQSSDGNDSENENESNDDDDDNYVIERVASPEASHNNYSNSDSDSEHIDNVEIASAEKQPLLPDHIDIMNSDDTTNSDIPDQYSHPSHDASPQLQFAGDGIDLNRIHGVATDAPILEPSTDMRDIYGEEDHKFSISIQKHEDTSDVDDEKLALDDIEHGILAETHSLISPKGSQEEEKKSADNVLLFEKKENDMEELEEISEMGDDDRECSINIEDAKQPKIVLSDILLPPDVGSDNSSSIRDMDIDDDSDIDMDVLDKLPVIAPKFKYDVSSDQLHRMISLERRQSVLSNLESPDSDQYNVCKPRRPLPPGATPSAHERGFSLSSKNITLLNGLRLGEMDVAIEICEMSELFELLSIICRAMTLLPFGLMQFREKLSYILQKRMCQSYELTQHFTFFLNSYRDCFAVSRLFKDSVCMESIVEIQPLNTLVQRPATHVRTPSQKVSTTIKQDLALLFDIDEDDEKLDANEYSNPNIIQERDRIEYVGYNVVEFFRLPLMYPDIDQIFCATQCTEFICPISGAKHVNQLEIRKIYNSNAKPLLIDCYSQNLANPVSSFILKYGDDLRRDAAVLMMFRFMNNLWIDNSHRYNNKQIAALTYKCFSLGPDYGIIELIPNCQTLKDITDKYVHQNKRNNDKLSDDVMHNLIATCAGSYIAAYIMGIRDRHYDNVLVTHSGTIFHIDFGYMLGEKVTGIDTSKMAITSDLAKLMGKKWPEFVQISVQCWVILRENHQELLDFAKLAFSFLYPYETVQDFLKETLLLQLSVEAGRDKINKRLLQAPKKLKTKLKNFVHDVANRARSGSSAQRLNNGGDRSPSVSRSIIRERSPEPSKTNKNLKRESSSFNNIFSGFLGSKRRLQT